MAQTASSLQALKHHITSTRVTYNRSIYSRGLNFQGQVGISNNYNYQHHYVPVPRLQNLSLARLDTDHSQNFAVLRNAESQYDSLLFWGWPLCTRTTYRFIEHYEKVPRIVRGIQKLTPFFKSGTKEPILDSTFNKGRIAKVGLGCGFMSVVDEEGRVFSWGDNYAGQLGLGDDIHREQPTLLQTLADQVIVDVSSGFQHCAYLNDKGTVFGIGKNNRFQLGKRKNEDQINQEIFDKYQGAVEIPHTYFNGEAIKQVACGKFHTLFLTVTGKLYATGFNKYGQCGVSNSLYVHVEEPVQVYTDGMRVEEISSGWHHTLLRGEDGQLYGFGARMNGQLDGTNHDGREEQCSIHQIKLPFTQKIKSFKAQNLRSYSITEDDQVWFWGGYYYNQYQKLCIEGFNLLNEEEGLPKDKKIVEYGMGFAHDTVMIEEESPVVKEVKIDTQ
ncbi:hypothetical protein FGO68_gene9950 [Halteria grandinella]|uniref:RCC1-like domain-containing protein n=1 Tax=Halteria grandinella TaxID=5974 RepID=A0A8J8NPI7_HALGN|nr:hypothetical protein FGO68_gene9950 [Halteria grandinella]